MSSRVHVPGESRREFRDRMASEGRLPAFDARYKGLLAGGMDKQQAFEAAGAEFGRLRGRMVDLESDEGIDALERPTVSGFPALRELEQLSAEDAAFLDGKAKVSERKMLEWVFEHVNVGVGARDAPSKAAWAYLCWVKMDLGNLSRFLGDIVPKLLAPKIAVEALAEFGDDGGPVVDMIGKLLAGRKAQALGDDLLEASHKAKVGLAAGSA